MPGSQSRNTQKPTVRLQRRRFPSISHEQTSGVNYKWGSEDVGRGEKKKMEEKEEGVGEESNDRFSFFAPPVPL